MKNFLWAGFVIRQARKKAGYTQEAVSHGICSVSYLSKIESGSMPASMEILSLLAKKLDVQLPFLNQLEKQQEADIFHLLETGEIRKALEILNNFSASASDGWKNSINGMLLTSLKNWRSLPDHINKEDAFLCMSSEQKSLYSFLNKDLEHALEYAQHSWLQYICAEEMYRQRYDDLAILLVLDKAYTQAAMEGHPYMMAHISALQGAICSNRSDKARALACFERSKNLFTALHDDESIEEIDYNLGCVLLETGRFLDAAAVFEGMKHPSVMDRHKLAICLEFAGEKQKALEVLDTVLDADLNGWDRQLIEKIVQLSRLRLKDDDYLKNNAYGVLLEQVFTELNEESLHKGFAEFYLPWMIEWLKASRKYAALCTLYENFPEKPQFELP